MFHRLELHYCFLVLVLIALNPTSSVEALTLGSTTPNKVSHLTMTSTTDVAVTLWPGGTVAYRHIRDLTFTSVPNGAKMLFSNMRIRRVIWNTNCMKSNTEVVLRDVIVDQYTSFNTKVIGNGVNNAKIILERVVVNQASTFATNILRSASNSWLVLKQVQYKALVSWGFELSTLTGGGAIIQDSRFEQGIQNTSPDILTGCNNCVLIVIGSYLYKMRFKALFDGGSGEQIVFINSTVSSNFDTDHAHPCTSCWILLENTTVPAGSVSALQTGTGAVKCEKSYPQTCSNLYTPYTKGVLENLPNSSFAEWTKTVSLVRTRSASLTHSTTHSLTLVEQIKTATISPSRTWTIVEPILTAVGPVISAPPTTAAAISLRHICANTSLSLRFNPVPHSFVVNRTQDSALASGILALNSSANASRNISTTISYHIKASTIRKEGFTFTVDALSCHVFNGSFQLVGDRNKADSLLSIASNFRGFVSQWIRPGGKRIVMRFATFSVFNPAEDDVLTFHWSSGMLQDAVAPSPIEVRVTSDRLFVNPQIKALVTGGTIVIGVSSGLAGAPAMAATANRQALLTSAANCPSLLTADPLPVENHPIGIELGQSTFRYHLGALLGNSLIVVGLVILHFLSAIAAQLVLGVPMVRGFGKVRFPTRTLPVLTFLLQPTLGSATLVALNSSEVTHFISSAAVWVLSLLITGFTGWALFLPAKKFNARFFKKDKVPRSFFSYMTYCFGHYIPKRLHQPVFLRTIGPIFEDYRPQVVYFFFIDVFVMILSGILMAVMPNTASECKWLFIAIIVVFGCYCVICLVTIPFTSIGQNILFIVSALGQLCSAVALFVANQKNNPDWMKVSEILNLSVVALQVLCIVYSFVKGVIEIVQDDTQSAKQSKLARIHNSRLTKEWMGFSFMSINHEKANTGKNKEVAEDDKGQKETK